MAQYPSHGVRCEGDGVTLRIDLRAVGSVWVGETVGDAVKAPLVDVHAVVLPQCARAGAPHFVRPKHHRAIGAWC